MFLEDQNVHLLVMWSILYNLGRYLPDIRIWQGCGPGYSLTGLYSSAALVRKRLAGLSNISRFIKLFFRQIDYNIWKSIYLHNGNYTKTHEIKK